MLGHAVVFVLSAPFGLALGFAFARQERDVAVPMPWAAVVAGFAGSFLLAGGLVVVVIVVGMAITHTGQ